ncbi:MAG: ATP-binding cassette domain-containing protein [Chitinophagales bacterium]|jgi:ABC-2 type transport system ATP-binding protein|nr:ATP-binding cassette domain-containing protein [Chitinophagales bacterium]
MEIIRTNTLTKYFGTTPASDNITIHVQEGEIYGFLGLNGAGKTTLIRMLLGMVKPDAGNISLFGKKLTPQFDQWNNIGYMVETPYAYPNLSVTENLKVYYKLRQLTNPTLIDDIMEKLKLTHYKHKKANVLSLGNHQRLGLAKALMHNPKLLILDEPINGLDPKGIVEVRELLINLANNGSTIFLSSHILGEISKVANRIGIIHEGKLVKELTTKELSDQLIKKILVNTSDNLKAVQELVNSNYKAVLTENFEIEITNSEAISNPENISKLLVEKNLPPKQLNLFIEDLEMYFLRTIRN